MVGDAGRIVVLDTEYRASTVYADAYAFDLVPLEASYDPLRYVEALQVMEGRYEVVIIDSVSHEWAGPGGCLKHMARLTASGDETARSIAQQRVMPQHHRFMQALSRCPAHLIVTLRATAYGLEQNRQGQWEPHVITLAPIQHEAFPYAFDIVGRLESVVVDAPPRGLQRVARLTMTSTHYPPLYGTVWDNPDETLGRRIQACLAAGTTSPTLPRTATRPVTAAWVATPWGLEAREPPRCLEGTSSAERAHDGLGHDPEGQDTRARMPAPPVTTRGVLLQQIRAELFRRVPALNTTGQRARRAVLQAAFGCESLPALGRLPLALLGRGLRTLLARQAPMPTSRGTAPVRTATARAPSVPDPQA